MHAPRPDTVERWAWEYVRTDDLATKLAPPAPPAVWEEAPQARRIARPGRPRALRIASRAAKTPGRDALRSPEQRARLVHTFLHHELQAAELMAWAILAFANAPPAFRRGLLAIALDEIRHMALYARHLESLGHVFGDFEVRDWFWERVPAATEPVEFVAVMGVGLEGGNLDHTKRFAERFRAVGDDAGAALQEIVGAEEIPHVRFALHWLERWAGDRTFATWRARLPPPLSPVLMRGLPLDRARRAEAGFSAAFMDELAGCTLESPGR